MWLWCVWDLCLFLAAPCVGLMSVIVVCLSSVSISHGALCGSDVCDCGKSEFCVYSSRRPVWVWCLWLWCVWVLCLFLTAPSVGVISVIVVCLSSVSIPHGALCGSEVCDCGVAVLVLCLFLTAPLCGSSEVFDYAVSKLCVYSSRRPVWVWSLSLWCVWVLCLFLMAPCVVLMSVIVVCLSSVSIPHGALCGFEVCDCGVSEFCVYSSRRPLWVWCLWLWCVWVLCLFLTAPYVVLKSVIVVCLSSVSIPHGALCGFEVCDCGVSEFCVYSSRRPVWFWCLSLWCVWVLCLFLTAPCVVLMSVIVVCLSSVSIPHGALCGSEVCDCGCV